jgi:hypothetical protein
MAERTTANGFCDVKWRKVLGAALAGTKLSIVLLKMHHSPFGSDQPPQSPLMNMDMAARLRCCKILLIINAFHFLMLLYLLARQSETHLSFKRFKV